MQSALQFLVFKEWWTYELTDAWPSHLYHWFNLFEVAVWVIIACLVLHRHRRYRNTCLEPLYSLAFLAFGLSDFQEAFRLQSWLILSKGVILLTIVVLRWYLIGQYYPGTKSF